MTDIRIKVLLEMDDMQTAAEVEAEVWGWDSTLASPTNVLRVSALKGGLVLGAYDANRMIGMAWAFPARFDGKFGLWSHVAGVLQSHQGKGIGLALKHAQRIWALNNGYDEIRWSYDPLQAGNANFNFRRLGCTVRKFYPNLYGIYDDAVNPGLPTDRFEAIWPLESLVIDGLLRGEPIAEPDMPEITLLEYADGQFRRGGVGAKPTARVEIPSNYYTLGRSNPDLARAWQTALRETITDAFGRGMEVTAFLRQDGRCWYVLSRRPR
jgi:predicted GNAT superfamily acetyltransferase